MRTAVLISGGGSNMVALVDSMTGHHPATPALVLSNRPEAGGLARAAERGVPTAVVDHRDFAGREKFEDEIHARLTEARADLVCLAGFMRILTPRFVARWQGRMLNIHPSLLPLYPGLDTHARALASGDSHHGCTVHEVTSELDQGPILGQARLAVRAEDTPETLASRVLRLEHRLYPAVLARFAAGDRTPVEIEGD
ncbi:phosphoribosylglycinamide formyltransferase [Histidinibacterium aquaticum]|uniref:Phosphoribosylglycinamide formyltransferase n=1 Tax=Histidinibacterium aquaticum TaxID=2613962 RepID=A0A5J5GQT5_9RHOB|nr:phosphoribosylglycinamide formyltransferase [Histidinibacterium aquaticum]KAA9009934.1 phosphoribosylglycinamide formyltransferase [Histidinibacterium aquaticum]